MMYWWVWVGGRVYRMFFDGTNIRYEGNGKYIVAKPPVKK